MAHHVLVDSRGVEHLYINFYLSTSKSGESHFWESPLSEHFSSWYKRVLDTLNNPSLERTKHAIRQRASDMSENLVHVFRRLTNQRVAEQKLDNIPSPPHLVTEPDQPQKQSTWTIGSIFGMFGGLKRESSEGGHRVTNRTIWEEGEVHADLVRGSSGKFQWRYLVVDLPSKNKIHFWDKC